MKSFAITLSMFFILVAMVVYFSSRKGIVVLEGYSEAVAFCGKEIEFVVFDASEATVKYDEEHDITYVINNGHKDDVAIIDLMALAELQCKQEVK